MPQSRVSVEEMQVASGGKCSKKGGGRLVCSRRPKKGHSDSDWLCARRMYYVSV